MDDPARKLPPLILHPFADAGGPEKLVQSTRANLMVQGLLPPGDRSPEELDALLLEGRYSEIRMLFYVGKDLNRWIEQCIEHLERVGECDLRLVRYQSFADMLVDHPPTAVIAKLRKWGVGDYRAIFTRALGLNALFAELPPRDSLSHDFLRNYYRYADHLYACRQGHQPFADLSNHGFEFEIYASGEYSRMLERQWQEQ
jgi:hypothetical protein